ncbi:hypothetical protein ArsFIN_35270 [Arsenophonus nasoniae]|uniref:Uncharacterized protein n=1 Tax=Arsenophonus nasoniae TaxID=638 RepID=A0A4P7L1H8_9GAMM|nr:hypothetical protein ArsFIN_35270 [Arsenophonus nasoniae]
MLLHEQIEHLCESLKLNSIPTHWSSLAEKMHCPRQKLRRVFYCPC